MRDPENPGILGLDLIPDRGVKEPLQRICRDLQPQLFLQFPEGSCKIILAGSKVSPYCRIPFPRLDIFIFPPQLQEQSRFFRVKNHHMTRMVQ